MPASRAGGREPRMGAVAGFGRGGVKGAGASLRDFLASLVALDPASTCPTPKTGQRGDMPGR